jgi:hypothetical protein
MLFLYLPFIIFETLMLSPRKRNGGELDTARSGSGLVEIGPLWFGANLRAKQKRGTDQSPRHRKIKHGAEAKLLTAFLSTAMLRCVAGHSSCLADEQCGSSISKPSKSSFCGYSSPSA